MNYKNTYVSPLTGDTISKSTYYRHKKISQNQNIYEYDDYSYENDSSFSCSESSSEEDEEQESDSDEVFVDVESDEIHINESENEYDERKKEIKKKNSFFFQKFFQSVNEKSRKLEFGEEVKKTVNIQNSIQIFVVYLLLNYMFVKHRLSYATLNDFLIILNYICGTSVFVVTFNTVISKLTSIGIKNYLFYYCYITELYSLESCGHSNCVSIPYSPISLFIKFLFSFNTTFIKNLRNCNSKNTNIIEDWNDGDYGKKMVETSFKDTLYLAIAYDELKLYKSISTKIIPFLVIFCNLPPNFRFLIQFIFCCCVIYNNVDVNIALLILIEEFKYFTTSPIYIFNCYTQKYGQVYIKFLYYCLDLAMKKKVTKIISWGGKNPCDVCDCDGIQDKESKQYHYPTKGTLRESIKIGDKGVNDNPVSLQMPYFHPILGFGLDIMHHFFVGPDSGLFNRLISLNIEKTTLTNKIINKSLSSIEINDNYKRKFRNFKFMSKLKAQEILNWSLVFFIVFKKYLKKNRKLYELNKKCRKYLIICICQSSKHKIVSLDKLGEEIIELWQEFNLVSLKCHDLMHFSYFYLNFGKVFLQSCFSSENYLSFIRGTQHSTVDCRKSVLETGFLNNAMEPLFNIFGGNPILNLKKNREYEKIIVFDYKDQEYYVYSKDLIQYNLPNTIKNELNNRYQLKSLKFSKSITFKEKYKDDIKYADCLKYITKKKRKKHQCFIALNNNNSKCFGVIHCIILGKKNDQSLEKVRCFAVCEIADTLNYKNDCEIYISIIPRLNKKILIGKTYLVPFENVLSKFSFIRFDEKLMVFDGYLYL